MFDSFCWQIVLPRYLELMRKAAAAMLKQWGSEILEIWGEVYALCVQKKDRAECLQIVDKMCESVKVRAKAGVLLGHLAEYDSLGCSEFFTRAFASKVAALCQDLHWEVRKSMCQNLIKISKYSSNGDDCFYKEICELVEDEEGEVCQEAFL